MSIGLNGISAPGASYPVRATSSGSTEASAKDDFLKYAKMTPAEKIREQILKKMGLTEEALAGMPQKELEKINDAIKEKIEELVKQGREKIVGAFADIKA
ncbi:MULTISPECIES: hypothetical protein [Methylobacterium]|nr:MULTISPECIES: hypothetical protein [Methylobacterium]KQO41132.1 hypothetical protein ASF08_15290 [Methylobacterium sp. Leaf85]MBD8904907.1 hypothetical protein [Methylobacterium bullatum]TXN21699.1 hypothetical protein FV220_22775 [Methylobacterium sp. WL19]GJD41041.1 hypothetical protein OICFNHDK_3519 [Methylobacterium bullatum]